MSDPSRYQQSLCDGSTFSVSWELVPGRGAFEKAQTEVIAAAAAAAAGGRVHALTLTDNPGGNPAISAEMLGAEVSRLGIEPVVHFACKDKNRNQLEGLLYGLERATVRNLLVMSGDYTYTGYQGRSAPVFDLDPTQLLRLIGTLNQGIEVPLARSVSRLAPTHFFAGAVVSPFKALEAEQLTQYYKLKKKLEAGAQFIVTQLGYDARKFHEAKLMLEHLGFGHVPLVGSVYVLSLGVARLMNRNGLPGCVAPDKLLANVEEEAKGKDKGRAAQLERAAQLYAVLKGMGYSGVHIGGYGMRYDDVALIIQRGEELFPNWRDLVRLLDYPQPDGWYYFQPDPDTGLNSRKPTDDVCRRPHKPFAYRAFRLLGKTMFNNRGPIFKPMRALARLVDGSPVERPLTRFEHLLKVVTNECLHCGDCALQDVAYICVTSQCPKNERNGPCGGGFQGWCEVYPHKKRCIYVRAFARLKSYGEQDSLAAYQVPPVNYDLRWTSSWLNFYLGRDHTAKRLGIAPSTDIKSSASGKQ
jgi:methylenetetrahydrofolate reductase (NADPH)